MIFYELQGRNYEFNDMFYIVILDLLTIMDPKCLGNSGYLFKKGEGAKAAHERLTEIGSKIPINPSRGLKARGHPLGATGVAQIVELVWQLRGEAGKQQVEDAKIGTSCNFGGFGNNILSILVERI